MVYKIIYFEKFINHDLNPLIKICMYNFYFYSPEAIVYFQFLPETENEKLKSCESC